MHSADRAKLEQLGLSSAEALIYLALLREGPAAAVAIATATGIKRPSVYPVLCSLADKGLVESGAGYGSKFAAVLPNEALPALILREKNTLSEREELAEELAQTLTPIAAEGESALDDTVQVIRTPQVIAERYHRLQMEAERQVQGFVKAPIFMQRQNPAQKKAGRRGVKYRGLYERAVLDDPSVRPFLKEWMAGGEEIRVYDGELPYKLTVGDTKTVLFTLVRRSGPPSAVFVRHTPFARSMNILFDAFWEQSEPLLLAAGHETGPGAAHRSTRRPNKLASGANGMRRPQKHG